MPFLVIFIVVPFIEIMLFATVGAQIGLWTTLGLAFLTAIIGGGIVKYQGIHALMTMRAGLDKGEMPVSEIFDGFCLAAAAALLITPGFLTDSIGFALLVPPVRVVFRNFLAARTQLFEVKNASGASYRYQNQDGDIIDGEYERVDPANDSAAKPSERIEP